MRFIVCNSQTGYQMSEESFEADSLEEAQALVLEGEGMVVKFVEEDI